MTQFNRLRHASIRRAIARSAGMAVSVFAYPWVEMLRSCCMQARSGSEAAAPRWEGPLTDAFLELTEGAKAAETMAAHFYANISHAVVHVPGRGEELMLVGRLLRLGLTPESLRDWSELDAPAREGLVQGFADAAYLVCARANPAQCRDPLSHFLRAPICK